MYLLTVQCLYFAIIKEGLYYKLKAGENPRYIDLLIYKIICYLYLLSLPRERTELNFSLLFIYCLRVKRISRVIGIFACKEVTGISANFSVIAKN